MLSLVPEGAWCWQDLLGDGAGPELGTGKALTDGEAEGT